MSAGIKFKSGPPIPSDDDPTDHAPDAARDTLLHRYRTVRITSLAIASPLTPEDQTVQSMPDVSPTKWHLAHTTWFFETFILNSFADGYREFDSRFGHLFNSYYHTVGSMHARPRRGLLSRPTAGEVRDYRAHVDRAIEALILSAPSTDWQKIAPLLTIGLHHEQQHQELMLTDIKHVLWCNPMRPAAYAAAPRGATAPARLGWQAYDGGIRQVGHDGHGFSFDNETPRHEALAPPFALASRPVTNGEYLAFIQDGGYEAVALWLSDGWARVQEEEWRHPLYWQEEDGAWFEFTLHGLEPLDPARPVSHVSYYEAQAFAAWSGKRLPTEVELETALEREPATGNLLRVDASTAVTGGLRAPAPRAADDPSDPGLVQLYGDVWEWTMSPYSPYPGFKPLAGSLGEYNGKFMCSQLVLKGGSCATPADHIRASYRNFFPPDARWQFSGIRLATDRAA